MKYFCNLQKKRFKEDELPCRRNKRNICKIKLCKTSIALEIYAKTEPKIPQWIS